MTDQIHNYLTPIITETAHWSINPPVQVVFVLPVCHQSTESQCLLLTQSHLFIVLLAKSMIPSAVLENWKHY